jgi:PAS domain S-box-containing protein
VALADADPDTVALLCTMFESLGHVVDSVSENGVALVEQCRVSRPDLVVTAAKMPQLDGIQASNSICRDGPLPVILLAPEHEPFQVQRMLDDHVLAYLVPPFQQADLETTVALVMRRFADFQAMQRQVEAYRHALARLEKLEEVRLKVTGLENQKRHSKAQESTASSAPQWSPNRYEQYRRSLETIPHAVQEIDTVGRFTFCNAAHGKLHGYAPGELLGTTIWALLASDVERETFRRALEERIAIQPPPISYTTRHRRKDSRIIDVQVDWTYKRDERGEVAGFISIITDITQLKQVRLELNNAREELQLRAARHSETLAAADEKLQLEVTRRKQIEESMRRSRRLASIGVLAAGIAHEINNPIVAALNSAETALAVQDQPSSGPMVQECLQNVVQSARRCGNIVKDVLKFARQEPTEKHRYSLNHVVHHILRTVGKVVGDSGAMIEVDLTDDPPGVIVNLLEMDIAVGNLVQNAMEAAGKTAPGRISIRTSKTEDEALLIVEDDGCGIKNSDLDRIFDPFFTTRKQSGGTGLGLSIVYAIVQDHQGTVDVQSEPGKGTKIVVRLPVVDQAIAEFSRPAVLTLSSARSQQFE